MRNTIITSVPNRKKVRLVRNEMRSRLGEAERQGQHRPPQPARRHQRPLALEVAPELLAELVAPRGAALERLHLAVLLALEQVAELVPRGRRPLVDAGVLGGADRQVDVGRVAHRHEQQRQPDDPRLAHLAHQQGERDQHRQGRDRGAEALEVLVAEGDLHAVEGSGGGEQHDPALELPLERHHQVDQRGERDHRA
ncbi:MAG: hypothetical protein E6K81_06690, partial [Candidatus Eisenbacteria bacterium]